jgi:hypothetical protein
MHKCGACWFDRLAQAIIYANMVAAENKAFAREKPRPHYQECRLKHVREYLVGTVKKMVHFCHELDDAVCYDKVVLADKLCRVHFDVEIKRLGKVCVNGYDFPANLKQHVNP